MTDDQRDQPGTEGSLPPDESGSPPIEEKDDILDLAEPLGATRSSPHAIAAFIAAVFALYQVPQVFYFPLDFLPEELGRFIGSLLVPVGAAAVALWLAGRAGEEIFTSDGRLGGVGFYRAARVLATVAIVAVVLGVAAHVVFQREPMEIGGVDFPDAPAVPAEPAP